MSVTVDRVRTAFDIADEMVDEICDLDPVLATQLGIGGSDDEWGDTFGLQGVEQLNDLRRRYRPELEPFLASQDAKQELAARVVLGELDMARSRYEAGDHFRDLRHLGSPFHRIRLTFDVMNSDDQPGRDAIVRRLETVDKPLGDYRDLLAAGVEQGIVVSRRQASSIIEQARRLSAERASIDEIARKVRTAGGASSVDLDRAADAARAAYGEFAEWLETRYLDHAAADDGVGGDKYARSADRLVGMYVDPDEAYAWGWEELNRLLQEQERLADQILPGEGVDAVREFLEGDPSLTASGTEELISFVESTLAEALDDLAGTHFEVPEKIRPLTVRLAPLGSPLGVYYRPPSEDFSRPGGVWYSIGDQDVFPLYQHVSTAYHEGFPGHHLQLGTAMYRRDEITRYQRLMTWCPGYGEGWGMYAEVLMGELGYLEKPEHYFGMLAKQTYRAARVVVDIGLHLAKTVSPASPIFAGEPWTFDRAVEFMRVYGFRTPAQARDEVLRYLGWPGQAICYKLGEREILRIREEARRRLGSAFDLKAFHSTVLNHGTMRLDLLREVVEERLAE